jgi:glutamyl-Q tRNA(Asp) synthetase
MEDLDTPRVVPGSAGEILEALQRYGLEWDGDVMMQSHRTAAYEEALRTLRERGLSYDCACSRAELQRAASAPAAEDPVEPTAPIYPGTCRNGVAPGRKPHATRFRVPSGIVAFHDAVAGAIEEDVARATGDFVVRRADGPFAYQLAVVVDDAAQNVSQVVRGGDLLSSTARQIALQRALDLPIPHYAHLPLILGADGTKLGKRDGALALPTLERARVQQTLAGALALLGVPDVRPAAPDAMLDEALSRFDPRKIPRGPIAYGG